MIKWREDVVDLSLRNKIIKEIGLDSAISVVQNQILPAELEYGGDCTLVRVDVARSDSYIWLFRTMDNYLSLRNAVSNDSLICAIDDEMNAWWKLMNFLNSEISARIGRYGGSDIGESIGYAQSYIIESRAKQLNEDLIAIKRSNYSSPDASLEQLYLYDIDDYLFASLKLSTRSSGYDSSEKSPHNNHKDYINQLIDVRNQIICWVESRDKVRNLIVDKKGYQESTIKFLSALKNIDNND